MAFLELERWRFQSLFLRNFYAFDWKEVAQNGASRHNGYQLKTLRLRMIVRLRWPFFHITL
jgi:hypothetical protein